MLDSMLQAGLTAGTMELLKTEGMRESLKLFWREHRLTYRVY
jgi:hypothetical protein